MGRVLTGCQPGLLNAAVGAEVGGEAQLGDGGTPVPQHLIFLPAEVDAICQHAQDSYDQYQHQGPSYQAQKQDKQQAQDQSHTEGTIDRVRQVKVTPGFQTPFFTPSMFLPSDSLYILNPVGFGVHSELRLLLPHPKSLFQILG